MAVILAFHYVSTCIMKCLSIFENLAIGLYPISRKRSKQLET